MEITRRLEFDAGHRVLNHEGKCKNLHGHRYRVDITVCSDGLDPLGRVVDFGVIKGTVGKWIDDNLDHNMILHPEDPLLYQGNAEDVLNLVGREPFIMPDCMNPTAENIARLILDRAQSFLDGCLVVDRVTVWETPNCWATYISS